MTKAELFEEIRALLLEPQVNTVEDPWVYIDEDLEVQVRSALRRIKAIGVTTDAVMASDGTLDPEPTEAVGLLVAYSVVSSLLRGDLMQKLLEGELGVLWRAGGDMLDTKTGAREFSSAAGEYSDAAHALLTIILTDQDGGVESVYGEQTNSLGV